MSLFKPAEFYAADLALAPPDSAPAWYAKFMSKISRPNGARGCWLWTGRRSKHGYGWFCFEGTAWRAHRFSFEKFYGPIQPGVSVLHACDNPACVNPLHLHGGTQVDNNAERDQRGRVRHGDRHQWSVLTAEQVRNMRAALPYLSDLNAAIDDFSQRYGVTRLAIVKVLTFQTWRRA